jgi:hypothetical protein
VIARVFALMLRQNLLPPAPEELQGQDIDIEYVSPLAKAQKLTDLQSVMRGMEIMLQVGQVAPVTDFLDADGLVRYIAETTGIPATVLRSDEQVAEVRRQQAQAQAQQAQMQQAMMAAEAGGAMAPLVKAVR